MVRGTAVVTAATETTWSALANITFESDLADGVYAVIGANCVAANAIAFRLFFPTVGGNSLRQLRPGGLVQDAANLTPWPAQDKGLGEWGRFHIAETPRIQTLADAAGGTYEIRLSLVHLGTDKSLLQEAA